MIFHKYKIYNGTFSEVFGLPLYKLDMESTSVLANFIIF